MRRKALHAVSRIVVVFIRHTDVHKRRYVAPCNDFDCALCGRDVLHVASTVWQRACYTVLV